MLAGVSAMGLNSDVHFKCDLRVSLAFEQTKVRMLNHRNSPEAQRGCRHPGNQFATRWSEFYIPRQSPTICNIP